MSAKILVYNAGDYMKKVLGLLLLFSFLVFGAGTRRWGTYTPKLKNEWGEEKSGSPRVLISTGNGTGMIIVGPSDIEMPGEEYRVLLHIEDSLIQSGFSGYSGGFTALTDIRYRIDNFEPVSKTSSYDSDVYSDVYRYTSIFRPSELAQWANGKQLRVAGQPEDSDNYVLLLDVPLNGFVEAMDSAFGKEWRSVLPKQDATIKKDTDGAKLSVGDIIKFGAYEWQVLDAKDGKAMLITQDVTHVNIPYNEENTDVTWETCTLRKWLNEEFYNSFSKEEQGRIVPTANVNDDNQWFETSGGKNTQDRIFLLSIDEIIKYFGDSGDLKNKKGYNWDKYKWILVNGLGSAIVDRFNEKRVAKYNGGAAWWWLRSPGYFGNRAAYVSDFGNVFMNGYLVDYVRGIGGVRPALWLKQ
jgi:hypothetical protein